MLSRAGFRVLQALKSVPDDQQAAQKNAPKSSEELMEVHCGGSQHGIDGIAGNQVDVHSCLIARLVRRTAPTRRVRFGSKPEFQTETPPNLSLS